MSTGFVKLYGTIIHSTIWQESSDVKVVWITMLTLADQTGQVRASVPGLARASGVSLEACEAALEKFMSPDPYSATPDHEGRRIVQVDGGWLLLNYQKYREMQTSRQLAWAEAKRKQRERGKEDVPQEREATAPAPAPRKTAPYSTIIDKWNAMAQTCGLSLCQGASEKRKTAISSRWADQTWRDGYEKALALIPQSDFLAGRSKDWKATFDWFLRPDSVLKILEGVYNNGGNQSGGGNSDEPRNRWEQEERESLGL